MKPWLAALVLLVAGLPALGAPPGFSSRYDELKSAIVLVVVQLPSGMASGSGFVVGRSDQGPLVVTNAHVVAGAMRIQVVINNKQGLEARALNVDSKHDLALCQVIPGEAEGWAAAVPILALAPEDLAVGEGTDVAVVGYPLVDAFVHNGMGVTASVSRGIVSAVRSGERGDFYQTDASITHGNSGGPAFLWETGEVVGVAVAGLEDRELSARLNFLIPLPTLRAFLVAQGVGESPADAQTPQPAPSRRRKAPPRADSGPSLELVLGVLALGLALVAGVVALVRLSTRPGGESEDGPTI